MCWIKPLKSGHSKQKVFRHQNNSFCAVKLGKQFFYKFDKRINKAYLIARVLGTIFNCKLKIKIQTKIVFKIGEVFPCSKRE